ncbi:hypothetical protein Tco_0011821 [Tanacetum coccineum]
MISSSQRLPVWESATQRHIPFAVRSSMKLGQRSYLVKSKPTFSLSTKDFLPRREITPPPGFSTLTSIPDTNVNELPPITTSTFTVKSPKNTPLAYRASTLANPDPMISPAFIEANYEVLKSLLWEHRRRMRNEDLRTELEYFSEEFDEERVMEPRPESARETTPVLRKESPRVDSILNYKDLKVKFQSHFSQQKKFTKTHLAVHNIKQREGESTRAFVTMYTDVTLQILGLHEEHRISGLVHGLKTRSLVEFPTTNLPTTYKGLMEKTYTWIEARDVATNETPNDHREGVDGFKKNSSWDNNKGSSLGQQYRKKP